jgi:hypothetical protein
MIFTKATPPGAKKMPAHNRVDCRKCCHYYVTWHKEHPHGCKAMGFMSSRLPSEVVYQNSGSVCLHFDPKRKTKHAERPDNH